MHFAFLPIVADQFLSTPSGWRATGTLVVYDRVKTISIHALRVEGDPSSCRPGGHRKISIHALRVEGDQALQQH